MKPATRRAVVLIAAFALGLSACGSEGAAEDVTEADGPTAAAAAPSEAAPPTASGEITFWHFFPDREEEAIQQVIADFEAENPDVTVTVKGGQDDEKMRQAIAAGKGPDVGLSYSTDIVGNFCNSGAWVDLQPWIERDNVDLEQLLPIVRSYTEYNGVRCSMPMLADAYGLYYNKTLLEEAGYDAPPENLSELNEMAVKLTKKNPDGSIDVAGFVPLFDFYENTLAHLAPSWGPTWLTDDGKSNIGSDPAWKDMLLWQRDLAEQIGATELHKFNASKGEEWSADNAFHQGKVAMMVDGEWRIAFLEDQAPDIEFGTAPFPVPDGQEDRYGAGYVTGNIMGISKGSDNPEAAWALIKYLTLDNDAIVKLANGIKNVPTTHEALESPDLEVDENFQTFLDIFEHPDTATSPATANGAVYQDQFGNFVTRWERGEVTSDQLDEGLRNVDSEINNALQLGDAP